MLKLHELRTLKGVTQKQLAEAIGVKNYTVGNWEQERSEPGIRDLIDLADFFECSVDYLIDREDDFGNIVISAELSQDQKELLHGYSHLAPERQKVLMLLLRDMLMASEQN